MDTIYHNGSILTMAGDKPTYVEALVANEGRIVFAGTAKAAFAMKGNNTRVVDLNHRTLLPGFIDGHSHYYNSLLVSSQCCVYAPPSEPKVDTVEKLIDALIAFKKEKDIQDGGILIAYGYDESVFKETLNRGHLDAVEEFANISVRVEHVSMHGGVLNLNAMRYYGFTEIYESDPPKVKQEDVPPGAVIETNDDDEIWGLIMETAWHPCIDKIEPLDDVFQATIEGQKLYAENGITTAQEGATMSSQFQIIKEGTELGANIIDVVCFPFVTELVDVPEDMESPEDIVAISDNKLAKRFLPLKEWRQYNKGLKIGGVKITMDGSPQGRTAQFTTPYNQVKPDDPADWCGEPTFPQEFAIQLIKIVHDDFRVPITIHTNGDAAIDNMLEAVDLAAAEDTTPWNVTTIHTQFMRSDHIPKFVARSIRPSFYTLHTFYFAEAHLRNRGEFEANYISPMRHAIDQGLRPSNHTDAVVAPLDQMMMLWSAVNRVSRDMTNEEGGMMGPVFGESQCATAYEGLKAMTEWAAEQYEEESIKGTLEPGKYADLVILDKDPLLINKLELRDIKIIATIKNDKPIYKREGEVIEGLRHVKMPERPEETTKSVSTFNWMAAHICDMCDVNQAADKTWKLLTLNGEDVKVAAPPTIKYGKGKMKKLEAFGGVNNFTASYAIVGERVVTGKLTKVTEKKGSKDLEELEQSFVKTIAKVESFKISSAGSVLTLKDGKKALATFKLVG